ncbi:MAG: helix-turn-helix transcriptional regulator [Chloroflexota bacterium]|nr:helix-turn-helix transcriptional regulator [Chloroflexota bacterium]
MSITPQEFEIVKQLTESFFSGRRQQLGLTQQELAEKTGVRKSTIQRIEYGKFVPGGGTLLSLVSELGLSLVFRNISENESFVQILEKTWTVPGNGNADHGSDQDSDFDMADTGSKIGNFFFGRRQQLGLTQKEVADQAHLGLPTIQRIEYGRHLPDGKGLFKVCGALQCVLYPVNFTGELVVCGSDD